MLNLITAVLVGIVSMFLSLTTMPARSFAQTMPMLVNPSFEDWPVTGPPTEWFLTGQREGESPVLVGWARSCMLFPYTGLFGSAQAVGVVKMDEMNCHLAQFLPPAQWRGRTLAFGAWVWSDAKAPTRVHVSISDGSGCAGGETHSAWDHPGDGMWHWIVAVRRINEDAGQVALNLSVEGTPGRGVFEAAQIMDVTDRR